MAFDRNEWYKKTYNKYIICIRKEDKEINDFIKNLCKENKFTHYIVEKIKEDLKD